jgi:hypothetical protein
LKLILICSLKLQILKRCTPDTRKVALKKKIAVCQAIFCMESVVCLLVLWNKKENKQIVYNSFWHWGLKLHCCTPDIVGYLILIGFNKITIVNTGIMEVILYTGNILLSRLTCLLVIVAYIFSIMVFYCKSLDPAVALLTPDNFF